MPEPIALCITLTISKHTINSRAYTMSPYLPWEYIMYWNNLSVSKATGKKACIFAKATLIMLQSSSSSLSQTAHFPIVCVCADHY